MDMFTYFLNVLHTFIEIRCAAMCNESGWAQSKDSTIYSGKLRRQQYCRAVLPLQHYQYKYKYWYVISNQYVNRHIPSTIATFLGNQDTSIRMLLHSRSREIIISDQLEGLYLNYFNKVSQHTSNNPGFPFKWRKQISGLLGTINPRKSRPNPVNPVSFMVC